MRRSTDANENIPCDTSVNGATLWRGVSGDDSFSLPLPFGNGMITATAAIAVILLTAISIRSVFLICFWGFRHVILRLWPQNRNLIAQFLSNKKRRDIMVIKGEEFLWVFLCIWIDGWPFMLLAFESCLTSSQLVFCVFLSSLDFDLPFRFVCLHFILVHLPNRTFSAPI